MTGYKGCTARRGEFPSEKISIAGKPQRNSVSGSNTESCRMLIYIVFGLPRSASDHSQIVYSTLRSQSIKNKTDCDCEPNSYVVDNLHHCMPCQPLHSHVGLSECQLSLPPHDYYSIQTRQGDGEVGISESSCRCSWHSVKSCAGCH